MVLTAIWSAWLELVGRTVQQYVGAFLLQQQPCNVKAPNLQFVVVYARVHAAVWHVALWLQIYLACSVLSSGDDDV